MQAEKRHSFKLLELLTASLPLPEQYRRHAFRLSPIWQIAIALMLNLLSLSLPIMMLQVYDRIIPHQAYGTLALLVAGVLVALAFDGALRLARAYLVGWTAASHEHAAGCAGIERLSHADLTEFDKHRAGTHLQHFAALTRLREFYSGQALTALVDLPFAGIFLLLIAYLGGWLVLVPLVLLGLFILFSQATGVWLKSALEERGLAEDCKSSYLISALAGIHTVKALGLESLLLRRFEGRQSGITKSSYHVALASGAAASVSAAFSQLSLVLTATAGAVLVVDGSLSVGGLSACTLLAGRALQPIQRVLGTWLRMQDFTISRAYASKLLTQPVQPRATEKLGAPEGRLALHAVTFSYLSESRLLEDITLDVLPGEVIAISGGKGSGKSSLLQLMAGLLVPATGSVMLDEFNPALYGLHEMERHIGYLPQQAAIFKGTILENITGFSREQETIEKAREIAHELGLDRVVDLLPKGYDTALNDSAADPVPPGVKQRIALARILWHRPSLLLFDDADRALDKEGYNRLFKVMGRLKGECSLVMTSHDQNLLSFADRFYHLEHGELWPIAFGQSQNLSLLTQPSPDRIEANRKHA